MTSSYCRSTSSGMQLRAAADPTPAHPHEITGTCLRSGKAWEPLPQIPAWELKQSVCSAAVTSGSPALEAVPRREGAARCRTVPSGAFPTGTPSPACRRRRIYGYAVRTTSTPHGKSFQLWSHVAYCEINILCFILPPGY